MITKMFGNFWTNVVLVVNFWSFKEVHVNERRNRGVTVEKYARQLKNIFQAMNAIIVSSKKCLAFRTNSTWISSFRWSS